MDPIPVAEQVPEPAAQPMLHAVPALKADPDDVFSTPIYLAVGDNDGRPKEERHLMVAANGNFIYKNIGVAEATLPFKSDLPRLAKVTQSARMLLPPMPVHLIFQAVEFFGRVYSLHGAEAILIPCYDPPQRGFGFWCPRQRVSRARIHEYDPNPTFKKDATVRSYGTFHSHCDFGSFHSGVDEKDEAFTDGLHVTIGNVNRENFTVTASIVINNVRTPIDPREHISGIEPVKSVSVSRWHGGVHYHSAPSNEYVLALTKGQQKKLREQYEEMIKHWMTKVSCSGGGEFVGRSVGATYNPGGGWAPNYSTGYNPASYNHIGVNRTMGFQPPAPPPTPSQALLGGGSFILGDGTTLDDRDIERIRNAYQYRDRDDPDYKRLNSTTTAGATDTAPAGGEGGTAAGAGGEVTDGECIPTGP